MTDAVVPTLVLVGAFVVASCWLAGMAEKAIGEHDSSEIVIDEVAGMWIALLWIPPTIPNLFMAFALFRILDVVKLWPAGAIDEQMPGGAGVVLDDVVSGIYANLLLRLFV